MNDFQKLAVKEDCTTSNDQCISVAPGEGKVPTNILNENPHEYYFSELQSYCPFTKESQLFPEDDIKCENLYDKKEIKY